MHNLLLVGLLLFHLNGIAQQFGSRSVYEKRWAFMHPFAAIKIKHIYKKGMIEYLLIKNEKLADVYENGGKLDAFRHVFFMAAFAQKINSKKVRQLGIAHEKGNYLNFMKKQYEHGEIPDSLSTVMDLYNNEIGIEIGKNRRKNSMTALREEVLKEMADGKMLYFKRTIAGDYLNCQGEMIDLKKFEGKWFIPKCLIHSNE